MISNYVKVAARGMLRHKGFSLINLAGLSLGMATTLSILLWVADELSYDRFHVNCQQIYRVTEDQVNADGEPFPVAVTPEPLGPGLKADFPEVLDYTRIMAASRTVVAHGETTFYDDGLVFADPSLLTLFTFPLVKGDPKTVLSDMHSIVISETAARKYFGSEDPVGQTLRIFNAVDFVVSGVARDVPRNSHLQFNLLGAFDILLNEFGVTGGWSNNSFYTYVQLHPGADAAKLGAQIRKYLPTKNRGSAVQLNLQPLEDIHLRSAYAIDLRGATHDRSRNMYILVIVAFLVLLTACINFMNLTTARSGLRSKEVGLRKAVGAGRPELMRQFFGESLLLAAISGAIALVIVRLFLPLFNTATGKSISAAVLTSPAALIVLAGMILVTGLVAGIYPALVMSAFKPAAIFRGESFTGSRSAMFRKALVVLQFSLSTAFIVGSFIVAHQVRYMEKSDTGYDRNGIIYFRMRQGIKESYAAFRNDLLQTPGVLSVAASSDIPTYTVHSSWGFEWEGMSPRDRMLMHSFSVDHDYIRTLGMEMAAGRGFSPRFPTDTGAYVVNEAAVRAMGVRDPIGKSVSLWGNPGRIIGVVKDFHYKSFHNSIEPLVLRIDPQDDTYALVRVSAERLAGSLAAIGRIHDRYNPGYPFEYKFLDESLGALYETDRRFGTIAEMFTWLAVFISCLGLFGLASFSIERRTKEIGVRKVLGARISGIAALLAKDFLRWVALSNLIALPVAYYGMSRWLSSYAYRDAIPAWAFVAAVGLSLGIALLTISYHCLRAATSKPVNALRYE